MIKKKYLIMTLIGIAGLGIVFLTRTQNTAASGSTDNDPQSPYVNPAIEVSNNGSEANSINIPSGLLKATPSIVENNQQSDRLPDQAPPNMIDIAFTLKGKIYAFINQADWIYVRRELKCDGGTSDLGTLPDGTIIPNEYFTEAWFHLDEKRLVDKHIVIQKTMAGAVLQTSIQNNGIAWNSISNSTKTLLPYPLSSLDDDVLERILQFASTNPAQVERTDLAGKSVFKFTVIESYIRPMQMYGVAKLVTGLKVYSYFDAESGLLLQSDNWVVYENGSEQQIIQVKVEIQAGVNPPVEIINMIQSKGQ